MDGEAFAIRFGYGMPVGASGLGATDHAVQTWPGATLADLRPVVQAYRVAKKADDADQVKAAQHEADALALRGATAILARAVGSDDPYRERLVAFWADHFTVVARNRVERPLPSILVDEAIRPHVDGRFADMLMAVTTHPAILIYLNQEASFGPGSAKGRRQKKGLNENLARELLELHTLGVGAGYAQADVRELAELLTGLAVSAEDMFVFDKGRVEPGAETVLGERYDGKGVTPILEVLEDLAARPETARHLAGKLAAHFATDAPDPALVGNLAAVYQKSGGDLRQLSEGLVAHPLAATGVKARQPFDFLVASLRALGVGPEVILGLERQAFRRLVLEPLQAMGQPFQQAPGPDGWPEAEADWITPQGLAARISWAMQAPERLVRPLPDPRDLLRRTLGDRAGERLVWAVNAAESARDGVGLILASPEFNRR